MTRKKALASHERYRPLKLMQTRRPKHSSTIEEFVPLDQRPKTYAPNRRCRTCHAQLSIYNSLDRCWACFPQGRRMVSYSTRDHASEVVDFQEITEGIDFAAMMEEEAA